MSIKKTSFLVVFLIALCNSLQVQSQDKLFLEGDAVLKFAVGGTSRQVIQFRENINVDVPRVSKFHNTIAGLNGSINYRFTNHFSFGIGSGLNVVQYQNNPLIKNEYYNNVMVPFYGRFRYTGDFSTKWFFTGDINGGYQYSEMSFGYTRQGYIFKENGGLLANFDLGVGTHIGKYHPILKIGYELNQFQNETSLGFLDNSLSYNDKIEYNTYYHLLKVSLSIQL